MSLSGDHNGGVDAAQLIRPLVERFAPRQVILFGSRARGDHNEHSDLDLIVVMEPPVDRWDVKRQIEEVFKPGGVSVDLHVTTPERLLRYGGVPGNLYRNALKEGKALHGGSVPPPPPLNQRDTNDMTSLDHAGKLHRRAKTDLNLAQYTRSKSSPEQAEAGLFHIQQAVEKAVKAELIRLGVDYPRTHDLAVLVDLLPLKTANMVRSVGDLNKVSKWAVAPRYDDIGTEDELRANLESAIGPAAKFVIQVGRNLARERKRIERRGVGR